MLFRSAQAEYDCEIGGVPYDTLSLALAAVTNTTPTTIKVMRNIDYNGGVNISTQNITFDLNSHELKVINTAGVGLQVGSGSIGLAGTGIFNVTGTTYGVLATEGGIATVTNATATSAGSAGARADGGGRVTVNSNAQGVFYGVYAYDLGVVNVEGNATASAADGFGAYAYNGGIITIGGNAIDRKSVV